MAYQDRDAVIVGAVRTPVGKGKASGALHGVLPADLLAHSLRELIQRTGVDPAQIDGQRRTGAKDMNRIASAARGQIERRIGGA